MKRTLSAIIVILIFFSYITPLSAEGANVVYVRDGGNGDGSSMTSPVGTLDDAYLALLNSSDIKSNADSIGTIVICGQLTVKDHFNYNGEISHKGKIKITSLYGDNDFRQSNQAVLTIHAQSKATLSVNDEHRFVLGGPTVIENLTIDRIGPTDASLTIYATTFLYISESVDIINSNWKRSYTEPQAGFTEADIDSILLSAHRGFQPEGPENSILSFEAAGKHGFDYIETDVIMTLDGELVCIHDSKLDRTTNGTGLVTQMQYADIRRFKIDTAAYGFDIASADPEKLYVPTFREYLEICQKYDSKPFIEIKDSRKEVIHKIIDTALEYFKAEEIIMSCGSLSALEISYEYNRDIFHHLIWGTQTEDGYNSSITVLSKMKDSHDRVYAGIAFNIKGLADKANYDEAKRWIDKAHAADLLTCLRGADDMDEVRLMFNLGIDYYPTNTTYPQKLNELREGIEGGYSYTSAGGGKVFIRGGSRCRVTKNDVSIILLGGMYDFVAPSNAEAESTGRYNVAIGGSAFVSRLVAGETAKNANGERESSYVSVKDNAVINDLYIAGDSSSTKSVTVEISGGEIVSIAESRGKGGTADKFSLILLAAALIPQSISIENSSIITGSKTMTVYGELSTNTNAWDNIMVISLEETTYEKNETTTDIITTSMDEEPVPDTEKAHNRNYAIAMIALSIASIIIIGMRVKRCRK